MKSGDISVAVIGGGPMGLAVSYQLSILGYKPKLFEADDRLGGMAASFNFSGLDIERYYHFHCLSDTSFIDLLKELDLHTHLKWKSTKMGFFFNNQLYNWGSIFSVLSFSGVSILARLRYLAHAARCLFFTNSIYLDKLKATRWLKDWLGKEGFDTLWSKLFIYKFYQYSNDISAAWICSRISRLGKSRRFLKEILGFLEYGSKQFIDKIESQIKKNEGNIKLSCPVISIIPHSVSGATITTSDGSETFDLVISTIPLQLVANIFEAGGSPDYLVNAYRNIPSIACACVVIRCRYRVTNNFWTNINDQRFAIPGIIEMSNLKKLPFNLIYIPFYMPYDHPDYKRADKKFIQDAWNCLKAINKNLTDDDLLDSHCNRYRYAQPICSVNFKRKLPPMQPFNNVYTLDTTAYYPDDRGISESIEFGRKLVNNIHSNFLRRYDQK